MLYNLSLWFLSFFQFFYQALSKLTAFFAHSIYFLVEQNIDETVSLKNNCFFLRDYFDQPFIKLTDIIIPILFEMFDLFFSFFYFFLVVVLAPYFFLGPSLSRNLVTSRYSITIF